MTREYGDVNGGQTVQGWSRALAGPYFSGFEPPGAPITGDGMDTRHDPFARYPPHRLLVETYRAMSIS